MFDVFLMIRLDLQAFWRQITGKVPFSLYQFRGKYQHNFSLLMLILIHRHGKYLSDFSSVNLFCPLPFSHAALWKELAMCSLHLDSEKLHFTFLRKHLYKLFRILLYFLPLYLFITYLHQYGLMRIYFIL